ncbi:MAG: DNA translocase FtsK, partial [Alistipes senegalensis]|uniref:DNA translocase FtsK n=1 Tax=Alistipes senegalensis TaxID=1288121 RepID=UPI00242FC6D8
VGDEPGGPVESAEPEETPAEEFAEVSAEALPAPEPWGEGIVVTVESNEARLVDEKSIPTESYDPLKDLVNYHKPPVTLLEDYVSDSEVSDEEIFENKTKIEETLKYFGIPIQRIKATVGPTVTLYEIVQAQGVKIAKIQGLQNDIAQSLKAESGIRIIAPIPGKGTIGIEVPNRNKQIVSMYSAVRSLRFQESKAELPVVIGRTIQNENFVFDLAKMPHLLVAGATGQGKSVGLNAIITSLLYRKHPAQLKFVMIDPKMVEFSLYAKIERHFLAKMESEDEAIVTDPRKAVYTLNSLCTEMDNRLELCKKAGARNISEYNEKFTSRRLNPLNGHRFMPYIVVVIDEFADLIMTAKEVETPVTRLAQKARAIGIHLIIATQRPSVDVITGQIKANFPARVAFRVMQMIDSRTILDRPGADQLIGRGDMLISKDGELTRIQCALVETKEVERIVDYISKQQGYTAAYALPDYTPDSGDGSQMGSEETSSAPLKYDSLFAEIARSAVQDGSISTSMIQRNYEVGFNRAGRIMMQLERAGIVGRQQGAKPRDILYHDLPSLEAKLQELGVF